MVASGLCWRNPCVVPGDDRQRCRHYQFPWLHGIPIAEHILGVMIMLARQLHVAYRYQLEGSGPDARWFDLYPTFTELHGRTAGIIGLGGNWYGCCRAGEGYGHAGDCDPADDRTVASLCR